MKGRERMIHRDSKMRVHHCWNGIASRKRGCIKGKMREREKMSEGGDGRIFILLMALFSGEN